MTKFRIVALTGFPTALAGVACGALLDINDRELETASDGGRDGQGQSTVDGDIILIPAEASIPPIQGSKCEVEPCRVAKGLGCIDAGGQGSVCQFVCETKDCSFTCPPGNDCEVDCPTQDSCKTTTCTGGHSCTFRCRNKGTCEAAHCSNSEICRFECNGPDDACKNTSCEAKECSFICSDKNACENVKGTGLLSCLIDCTGEDSCLGDKSFCNGGSPRINCTDVSKETCKGGVDCQPANGQTCTIHCAKPQDCKYCCDTSAGGNCAFEGQANMTNNCK